MTRPEPTVVGINRTQDGSIAVTRGGATMYSLQKERLSRRKHHWGRLGDLPKLYSGRMPWLDGPVDLVVEGWSSDAELERIDEYHAELRETLQLTPDARIVQVSHHITHLYSAFHPSPFDVAAGLVVDNQGSAVRHFTDTLPLPQGTNADLLEVSSFYRCERGGRIECFAKQLWDGDWDRPVGLGCFYALLTKMLWPEGEGNEGKVMGLAPFGDPGAVGLPPLEVRGHEVFIPEEWVKVFSDRETFRWTAECSTDRASFQACADLAAAGQQVWEDALMQLVGWLHEQTGLDDLVFAGGCGLNCTANGTILRESAFRDVFIPPSPHDGGTAVGLRDLRAGGVPRRAERLPLDERLPRAGARPRGASRRPCGPRGRAATSTSSARATSRPPWSTCWSAAGWWRCTRAAASRGHGRSATAASSATRACRPCRTTSTST